MARAPRTVRLDPELEAQLEELVRQRLVPVTFTEQVNAGLRLLVQRAQEERTRHAARLVGADHERAERTYRKLQRRRP